MSRTYARILIDEFEMMKKEYDYNKFISTLTPIKNRTHHLEIFINNLEYDLNKLIGTDGNYISKVDNPDFGNGREYQVTLTLLRRFTMKLTSDYKLQDASSM